MKIDNAEALAILLGNEPEAINVLSWTIPYVSVEDGRSKLTLRCSGLRAMSNLLKLSDLLSNKLGRFLGFEICLECIEKAIGEVHMVAVAEERAIAPNNSTLETKFLSLETLSRATNKSLPEVKALLGKAREVIHPTEDGREMITESAFDAVVLQWAKSFKEEPPAQTPSNVQADATEEAKAKRKASPKVLTSELTADDIITVKSGANAGTPSLTSKSIQQVLENFFNKVKLEDTTKVDAVSAFIEGTSEFGQALRKKILGAYKKFSKGGNPTEIQERLIDGAKTYLESMAATAAQE
ncbi:hypothetical protein [Dendronalium sp. ChiSLP03b]|uniref:hypothetical protein n=1 Tax=Dendronalium sp. ChiSLP03b TaxID=3075381 RepID=UPI003919CCC6